MDRVNTKSALARSHTEAKFAKARQRDLHLIEHQRGIWAAETAKLIRLRSQRLAKENADQRAEAAQSAETGPNQKRGRRVKSAGGRVES